MFDWFFNLLDPKILKMEVWVNRKVIEPGKIDIDLDRIKKDEVRENTMVVKAGPSSKSITEEKSYGPYLVNLQGAKLMGFMFGPGQTEAFSLFMKEDYLWWRHRDGGSTQDFKGEAFDDMEEFVTYIDANTNFWNCALRTEALCAERSFGITPELRLPDIKGFISEWREAQ